MFADNQYSICGVILYEQPNALGMNCGHYVTAAKTADFWTVFDDTKKKSSAISPEKEVSISSILYIKLQN